VALTHWRRNDNKNITRKRKNNNDDESHNDDDKSRSGSMRGNADVSRRTIGLANINK